MSALPVTVEDVRDQVRIALAGGVAPAALVAAPAPSSIPRALSRTELRQQCALRMTAAELRRQAEELDALACAIDAAAGLDAAQRLAAVHRKEAGKQQGYAAEWRVELLRLANRGMPVTEPRTDTGD